MGQSRKEQALGAEAITWQDYEELVKDINLALGKANGIELECWGRTCKVTGRSGVTHQIDVLTRHQAGLHEYRTAIECKHWNKKVGQPHVVKFAGVIDDTKMSKGVIVSKLGFTEPALLYAQSNGIELVELRKPLDTDWDGYIREIRIDLTYEIPSIRDLQLEVSMSESQAEEPDNQGDAIDLTLIYDDIVIETPEEGSRTLRNIVNEMQKDVLGNDERRLLFAEGSKITLPCSPLHPLHDCSISGVSFKVQQNPPIKQEIVIRPLDYVYMIMESLFDGQRFTITTDGEIVENTTGN